jgi:hypothetical protein
MNLKARYQKFCFKSKIKLLPAVMIDMGKFSQFYKNLRLKVYSRAQYSTNWTEDMHFAIFIFRSIWINHLIILKKP